ncbi:antiviral reverse transcriptase Drt3a [Novosphingobium sp. P6W]|uniref:antiviral reverse transcriptase Drt3a n=1 Tax=Novosphingobium sp. P6W TaxID=1609758 RepID=UPI000AC39BC0|nr:antiviral reverse transcriptase Drt3a [Novosphingobium sp. P6W]
MLDNTLHAKTIARQFRSSDFRDTSWAIKVSDKAAVVEDAVRIANDGFRTVSLRRNGLGDKSIYRHAALHEALLIRHISETLRRITGVRQSDRKSIVKSLIALTSEGIPFGILKFDIKSFYETVNTQDIVDRLRKDAAFSRQSIMLIETFFSALQTQAITGLPRGVGLSATLAEYALRDFDAAISNLPGVRFYSRYVDDGIIVVSDKSDLSLLRNTIADLLPPGLQLNKSKTTPYKFSPYTKRATIATEHDIKFLGYSLSISQVTRTLGRGLVRNVHVDIAPSKISKIKRRISLSLLNFKDSGNFDDFLGRIKLLTSNFGFIDDATGQQRYSGVRYNYGLIDPNNSPQLQALDRFLTNVITSGHPNNRLRPILTKAQRAKVLGFGFSSGFLNNRFFSFDDDTLKRLIGCWSHA